ncbi:MAG: hypothetical protein ABSE64_16890 [Vulcanimicrobiaceae bacterium]|jgi:hypothetical protein
MDSVLERRADAYLATLRGAFDPALDAVAQVRSGRAIVKAKAFSDNIVFSVPIRGDAEDELFMVIRAVALFQSTFALKGFFIRGSIVIGSHHMDKELVFGEAIIEAYREEQDTAVNPRVILSLSAVSSLAKHREKYEGSGFPQGVLLLTDVDGKLFVHYLAALGTSLGLAPAAEKVNLHRDQVARQLQLHAQQPTIWTKYVWVARYHNFCCGLWKMPTESRIADATINADPQPMKLGT